jgi:hypothetical protein
MQNKKDFPEIPCRSGIQRVVGKPGFGHCPAPLWLPDLRPPGASENPSRGMLQGSPIHVRPREQRPEVFHIVTVFCLAQCGVQSWLVCACDARTGAAIPRMNLVGEDGYEP